MVVWTCLGTSACLGAPGLSASGCPRDSLSRWVNCFMDSASSELEEALELVEEWDGPDPLPPLPPQGEGVGGRLAARGCALGGGTGTAM